MNPKCKNAICSSLSLAVAMETNTNSRHIGFLRTDFTASKYITDEHFLAEVYIVYMLTML